MRLRMKYQNLRLERLQSYLDPVRFEKIETQVLWVSLIPRQISSILVIFILLTIKIASKQKKLSEIGGNRTNIDKKISFWLFSFILFAKVNKQMNAVKYFKDLHQRRPLRIVSQLSIFLGHPVLRDLYCGTKPN